MTVRLWLCLVDFASCRYFRTQVLLPAPAESPRSPELLSSLEALRSISPISCLGQKRKAKKGCKTGLYSLFTTTKHKPIATELHADERRDGTGRGKLPAVSKVGDDDDDDDDAWELEEGEGHKRGEGD